MKPEALTDTVADVKAEALVDALAHTVGELKAKTVGQSGRVESRGTG